MRSGVAAAIAGLAVEGMFALVQGHLRQGDGVENAVQQCVAADIIRQRFVRKHQAVADHIQGQVAHILGQGVGAPAQVGQRPGGEDQVDRGARAGAKGDERRQVAQADQAAGRGSP